MCIYIYICTHESHHIMCQKVILSWVFANYCTPAIDGWNYPSPVAPIFYFD